MTSRLTKRRHRSWLGPECQSVAPASVASSRGSTVVERGGSGMSGLSKDTGVFCVGASMCLFLR